MIRYDTLPPRGDNVQQLLFFQELYISLFRTLIVLNCEAGYFYMDDDNISISAEHSAETNSVDSLGRPGWYRTTFPGMRHFPLPSVAISEPEYKNGIFHAIIYSMRAGIVWFNGSS